MNFLGKPCQDPLLNDCSPFAQCESVGANNYTCKCLPRYVDRNSQNPGRQCVPDTAICADPKMNDCHPYAVCTPTGDQRGFRCQCRDGWVDENPQEPGRQCRIRENPCLDRTLNDCHPFAVCTPINGTTGANGDGYICACRPGFKDQSPDRNRPGRDCLLLVNECLNPQLNNCSRNARCTDLEVGYECRCLDGFKDSQRDCPDESASRVSELKSYLIFS